MVLLPHPFQLIPSMLIVLQYKISNAPKELQNILGLLCPSIVIFSKLISVASEGNSTLVVMLIRTLLVRLFSAARKDLQRQSPVTQQVDESFGEFLIS